MEASPLITIVIATFNSEKILPLTLRSIREQSYPQDKIEVLVIDGGSSDRTQDIARQFSCVIIDNPKTEPVNAKFLGYLNAHGQYLMYLDSDEVLENPESLRMKQFLFVQNPKVKAVVGTGYVTPAHYPFINTYINEFGDPFSFFIYRFSKDAKYFLALMTKRYKLVDATDEYMIFDFSLVRALPIIELCAAGSMIDRVYMQHACPETLKRPELIPHFFYLLRSQAPYIGVTKNDTLLHYSSDTMGRYRNKIRWRVKNNIYHVTGMGNSGFTGRDQFQPFLTRLKKYLFLPYCYSLVVLAFDAVQLAISRRNPRYILHIPLSLYTANLILFHTCLKMAGRKPKLRSYDESKVVA